MPALIIPTQTLQSSGSAIGAIPATVPSTSNLLTNNQPLITQTFSFFALSIPVLFVVTPAATAPAVLGGQLLITVGGHTVWSQAVQSSNPPMFGGSYYFSYVFSESLPNPINVRGGTDLRVSGLVTADQPTTDAEIRLGGQTNQGILGECSLLYNVYFNGRQAPAPTL